MKGTHYTDGNLGPHLALQQRHDVLGGVSHKGRPPPYSPTHLLTYLPTPLLTIPHRPPIGKTIALRRALLQRCMAAVGGLSLGRWVRPIGDRPLRGIGWRPSKARRRPHFGISSSPHLVLPPPPRPASPRQRQPHGEARPRPGVVVGGLHGAAVVHDDLLDDG